MRGMGLVPVNPPKVMEGMMGGRRLNDPEGGNQRQGNRIEDIHGQDSKATDDRTAKHQGGDRQGRHTPDEDGHRLNDGGGLDQVGNRTD
jgi:hypothetical protein